MIEEGKRYVMRNGDFTDKIYRNSGDDDILIYPWTDGVETWTSQGKYFFNSMDNPFDIIREATQIDILSNKFGL